MNIIGINCYGHDSSVSLIVDGQVINAVEEERFNRQKHCSDFPYEALRFIMETHGFSAKDINHVAYYWNPLLEPTRIMSHLIRYLPASLNLFKGASFNMPFTKRFPLMFGLKQKISSILGGKVKVNFVKHHYAHAASSYFCSPFEEAAILSMDGLGEWATTWFGIGENTKLECIKQIDFPHSLGMFYASLTAFLGFKPLSGEWKVMGLAPYGKAEFIDVFRDIIKLEDNGSFSLNMDYFQYHTHGAKKLYSDRLVKRIGEPRIPESEIQERHKNIASSLQQRVEEVFIHLSNYLADKTRCNKLCVAGGVGLNCVANGKIVQQTPFKQVYVPMSPADSGTSMGAALYSYYKINQNRITKRFHLENSRLGPEYSDEMILAALENSGLHFKRIDNIAQKTAVLLDKGKIVSWFQGKMEFGPRALGGRSILADPRKVEMKDIINSKVKYRESFRPFAPSILDSHQHEFFNIPCASPFMSFVLPIQEDKRTLVPAITHQDGTARLQTVSKAINPIYWEMINHFYSITGIPMVLNTSFNIRGEPIVNTPLDAIKCLKKTSLDYLAIGSFLVWINNEN